MVTHKCERCGYTTTRRSTFAQHLGRKFPCKPKLSDKASGSQLAELLVPKAKPYKCATCARSYGSKSALRYHNQTPCQPRPCPLPDDINSLRTLVEHLTIKCADLEARNRELEAQLGNRPSTSTTLNPFGSEDTSYIPNEVLDNCAELVRSNRESAITHTLQRVFFDEHHPENHNVRLKSVRMGTVEIFKEGGWVPGDLKDTAKKMAIKCQHIILTNVLHKASRQREEQQEYQSGVSRALEVLQQPIPPHMLCRIRRTVVTSLQGRV